MSTKFDGFSQEEINKINSKPKKGGLFTGKPLGVGRGIRKVPDKIITSTSSQNDGNIIINQKYIKNSENGVKVIKPSGTFSNDSCGLIDYNRKISDESLTKLREAVHFQPLSVKNEKTSEMGEEQERFKQETNMDESILNLSNIKNKSFETNKPETSSPIIKIEKFEIKNQAAQMSPFRGVSLKDFESQRKVREEQNKIKKDILYKAIEKHTQKTAAEVKKIEEIKNELAKLDQDLAADVLILRKQIETACLHYSNIEKHYNKVEQMFLKAKLDLHHASEKKELLTEHLCTVITYNEDRKAKKLSELMEKVGLSPTGEDASLHSGNSHCVENRVEITDK